MIQISQIKLPIGAGQDELIRQICRLLRIRRSAVLSWQIVRRSIDARRKPDLFFVYTVRVQAEDERRILQKRRHKNITSINPVRYRFPMPGAGSLASPPVVVGAGPAGLFAAYLLALHGYRPILLERGEEAENRTASVNRFWRDGVLDPDSNVQFGEGGAGTFSDGKLNTGIHDKSGRISFVLETFVKMGAPRDILFEARPHLGTDLLTGIVSNLRKEVCRLGGTVKFRTRMDELIIRDGSVRGVRTSGGEILSSEAVVLAIGHSARDTFEMLRRDGVPMEAKPFAVGVRVEHPQEMINLAQYGSADPGEAGPAPYRLTCQTESGRGVYSFCMCPGGYVVNASSEPGRLAVNGMSLRNRNGKNANSAIVVSVGPEDFLPFAGSDEVLAGMYFQRELERRAWELAEGSIPVQRLEDFRRNRPGDVGSIHPEMKGAWSPANVRSVFPDEISGAIADAFADFDRKIDGFGCGDAVLSGVESRTSSPVRILREKSGESAIKGLFPCGEGAGYAGGIVSAAVDGMKIAEKIAVCFRNF